MFSLTRHDTKGGNAMNTHTHVSEDKSGLTAESEEAIVKINELGEVLVRRQHGVRGCMTVLDLTPNGMEPEYAGKIYTEQGPRFLVGKVLVRSDDVDLDEDSHWVLPDSVVYFTGHERSLAVLRILGL